MNSIMNNGIVNGMYIGVSIVLMCTMSIVAIVGTIKMLRETNRIKDRE